MQYLTVILKLLELILGAFSIYKAKESDREDQQIRDNPRDFFDDGLLNNSDTSEQTNVPSPDSTDKPV